ncbi:hypothetical protein [Streptomyces phage phiScoe56]|nr:hypothetical protein [Streptomyces phage phiScoe56]
MTREQARALVAERRKLSPPLPLTDDQLRAVKTLLGPVKIAA